MLIFHEKNKSHMAKFMTGGHTAPMGNHGQRYKARVIKNQIVVIK